MSGLSSRGWVKAPHALIEACKGDSTLFVVVMIIRAFARQDPTCWPSQDAIAKEAGVTSKTVQRAIRRAESLGLIETVPRQGTSNLYRPLEPWSTPDSGVQGGPRSSLSDPPVTHDRTPRTPVSDDQDPVTKTQEKTTPSPLGDEAVVSDKGEGGGDAPGDEHLAAAEDLWREVLEPHDWWSGRVPDKAVEVWARLIGSLGGPSAKAADRIRSAVGPLEPRSNEGGYLVRIAGRVAKDVERDPVGLVVRQRCRNGVSGTPRAQGSFDPTSGHLEGFWDEPDEAKEKSA